MVRLRTPFALAVVLAALAACAESPVAPEVVPETPADASAEATLSLTPEETMRRTTSTSTVSVKGCTGTWVSLTLDEKASLDLHNKQRALLALRAFCVHPRLQAAARGHSADMIAKQYFSHTSPSGETFVKRLVRYGYTTYTRLAENIAWGSGTYGSPASIMDRWMKSTGHRANIQNANLREVGIGAVYGKFLGYSGARVWTVDFGTRP